MAKKTEAEKETEVVTPEKTPEETPEETPEAPKKKYRVRVSCTSKKCKLCRFDMLEVTQGEEVPSVGEVSDKLTCEACGAKVKILRVTSRA